MRIVASDKDEVLLKAAEWIVRSQDEDFSREDAAELAAWRAEHPQHERSYLAMQELWSDLPQAAPADAGSLLAANDDGAPRPAERNRVAAIAAAGIAASVIVFAAAHWFVGRTQPTEYYTTDVAQISKITLEDGSVATLAPRSAVSVTFSRSERHVVLRSGEAFFDVARNPERPFVVDAGTSRVRVVGTHFNVKRTEHTVQVSVLQGAVRLSDSSHAANSPPSNLLRRGDHAEVVSTGKGTVTKLFPQSVDLRAFGAIQAGWRDGWLVYENAPLGDIVADLNRYYRPGIILLDPELAQLRVTASFKTTGISQFVASMEQLFPVEASRRPDGSYEVRRDDR